jgi:hypothetical protein
MPKTVVIASILLVCLGCGGSPESAPPKNLSPNEQKIIEENVNKAAAGEGAVTAEPSK